jgi:peptidoglycan lytic transglycosylase B
MRVAAMLSLVLSLAVLEAAASARNSATTERAQAVEAFVDEMAQKHGFDRAALAEAFGTTKSRTQILELMDRAAEPKPWEDYRDRFVNGEKVQAGLRFWAENEGALDLAWKRYGVPEEIITAIIGIETHYGRHRGRYKVLEALATLTFDYPRRASQFRLELEHFLLLAREESLPLGGPLGSYAGAMGIAQFMPGSYRRYGVDFDGDGKRDLFENTTDAIGSVANYLTAHGWQRSAPVAAPADVAGEGIDSFRTATMATRYRLEELTALGVTIEGIHPVGRTAIPLTLKSRQGPEYWVGFQNFYVITRYNQSIYYAMAVFQLAQQLRAGRGAAKTADDR